MKKIIFSLTVLLLIFSFSLTITPNVEASPGGLDRKGGDIIVEKAKVIVLNMA